MNIHSPKLFIEINNLEYIFSVGDKSEKDSFKLIYKLASPMCGIENSRIINLDLVFSTIKKNVYLIEQKLNFTFTDVILIIDNFNCSFLNMSGFKKLNSSQILKENITYILNSLKSSVDEFEDKKTILHIFNSKYYLDGKKIENLPIGLFGDFYSHELSFCLMNNNDYKNLNKIFDKCNLKIRKILLKSFVEGSHIINKSHNLETFFQIQINKKNSQLIYFENSSLKLEQNYHFGSDLIINDISKVISLDKSIIKKIITNLTVDKNLEEKDLINRDLFEDKNYRKIKKKLIFEIANARIQELSEIIIIKNINLLNYHKKDQAIFLKVNDKSNLECFKENYKLFFSKKNFFKISFVENILSEDLIKNAHKLVHFGWKKEAIPVTHYRKSMIARIFDSLFN
jgi:cell division protein FtsA